MSRTNIKSGSQTPEQLVYTLTRREIADFMVDSLGYDAAELDQRSVDELRDLIPGEQLLNCYHYTNPPKERAGGDRRLIREWVAYAEGLLDNRQLNLLIARSRQYLKTVH